MQELFEAVQNGNINTVDQLLGRGVNINSTNKFGAVPLYIAAASGNVQMVQFLLENGAKVDGVNNGFFTPLYIAASGGFINVVKLLISAGANVNWRSSEGYSAISVAALNGHADIVECLISASVDVNSTDNRLNTPLHGAASRGRLEVAKVLVSNGANVNAVDSSGATPLGGMAMYRGKDFPKQEDWDSNESLNTAKFLLENGADPNAGTYKGIIYDFAKKNKDEGFMKLLVEYGFVPAQGGCYVATCVYGSYNCQELWVLRRYRDEILRNSWYGQIFIKIYYAISPIIVKVFGGSKRVKSYGRVKLDRLVSLLIEKGFDDSPYSD